MEKENSRIFPGRLLEQNLVITNLPKREDCAIGYLLQCFDQGTRIMPHEYEILTIT